MVTESADSLAGLKQELAQLRQQLAAGQANLLQIGHEGRTTRLFGFLQEQLGKAEDVVEGCA